MANPTDYISIYKDTVLNYGLATTNVILNYSKTGYVHKFRVFIPPNTTRIVIKIEQEKNFTVVSRHKQPPQTVGKIKSNYETGNITLKEYTDNDYQSIHNPSYTSIGPLILSYFKTITTSECGWFYIDCGPDPKALSHSVNVSIEVDKVSYNTWYSTIKWETDIEGVTTYGSAESPPGDGVGLTFYPVSPLDFGTQLVNKSKTKTLTITNISLYDITINSIECPDCFTYSFAGNAVLPYQSYDYISLYQGGKKYKYTDNGTEKEITYKGFKNIYNFSNSIIVNEKTGSSVKIPEKWNFDIDTLPHQHQNDLLRIFIPYGTSQVSLTLNTSSGAEIVAIVRWKNPLTYKYVDTDSGFLTTDYSSANTSPSYLTKLSTNETKFRCVNNKITIIDGYLNQNLETENSLNGCGWSELEMQQGVVNPTAYSGWLYVLLKIKSGTIINTVFNSNVFVANYFNYVQLTYDPYDDPYDAGTYYPPVDPPPDNLTGYETMHDPLHRFPDHIDTGFITLKLPVIEYYHWSMFSLQRVFIPPGTKLINFGIGKSFVCTVVSRYLQPPNDPAQFINILDKYYDPNNVECTYEEAINQTTHSLNPGYGWVRRKDPNDKKTEKVISNPNDGKTDFYTYTLKTTDPGVLPIQAINLKITNDCGWFYMSLKSAGMTGNHKNVFTIEVDTKVYNEWWDNGGIDGVIDWNKDVEQFETYNYKTYTPPPKKPKLYYDTSINKSGYRTIHDPYYWLQDNVGEIQNYTKTPASDTGYMYDMYTPSTKSPAYTACNFISNVDYLNGSYGDKQLRVFLPPGTLFTSLTISNKTNCMMESYSRFKVRPEKDFPSVLPTEQTAPIKVNIENEHYSSGTTLTILDNLDYKILDSGGWFYINIKTEAVNIAVNFSVNVYIESFNTWWKNYGSKTDKSINWDIDIEQLI